MDSELIVSLGRESIRVAFLAGAPVLIAGALIGLIIGVVQAATQIQDQTLAFAVKLLVILGALAIFLPYSFSKLGEFTSELFQNIPETVGTVLSSISLALC